MSENIKYLNDENFDEGIAKGVALVDFYADWCGPCRMIAPIIKKLADDMHGQATIAKVDIEHAQRVAGSFQVTSIPTLILFKDGEEIERITGVRDENTLKALLQSAL